MRTDEIRDALAEALHVDRSVCMGLQHSPDARADAIAAEYAKGGEG